MEKYLSGIWCMPSFSTLLYNLQMQVELCTILILRWFPLNYFSMTNIEDWKAKYCMEKGITSYNLRDMLRALIPWKQTRLTLTVQFIFAC